MTGIALRKSKRARFLQEIPLHLMLIPSIALVFVYHYLPMFGIVMSFQKFNPFLSFSQSAWVGWANFKYVFNLSNIGELFRNTVEIAILKILCNLLMPLIIALLLNELHNMKFKRVTQTMFFIPYFLSWVVLGGVFKELFSLNGSLNDLIYSLTGQKIFFMGENGPFRIVLIITDCWKNMGYNMIIYHAAITNVNPALYEAASIDGCGRARQCWHVTLPGIRPMIVLLATLAIGNVLNAGFDQIFNLYNPLVYESSDIIDTFVYRLGLINRQYSVSAALGLFKSLISLVFVGIAYFTAYKVSDYRIF